MPFIGNKPTAVPLTSSDLEDSIVTSAKITDGTITLADLSATGTKDATTFLRGDNTFAEASGGVVQTQYYFYDSTFSATNTSWSDLGSFSISITPTSASNKILISAFFGRITGSNTGANTVAFRFTRNGTAIGVGQTVGSRDSMGWGMLGANYSSQYHSDALAFSTIDTPSTTSTLTYKIQNYNEGGTLYINRNQYYADDTSIYNATASSLFIVQEIT